MFERLLERIGHGGQPRLGSSRSMFERLLKRKGDWLHIALRSSRSMFERLLEQNVWERAAHARIEPLVV